MWFLNQWLSSLLWSIFVLSWGQGWFLGSNMGCSNLRWDELSFGLIWLRWLANGIEFSSQASVWNIFLTIFIHIESFFNHLVSASVRWSWGSLLQQVSTYFILFVEFRCISAASLLGLKWFWINYLLSSIFSFARVIIWLGWCFDMGTFITKVFEIIIVSPSGNDGIFKIFRNLKIFKGFLGSWIPFILTWISSWTLIRLRSIYHICTRFFIQNAWPFIGSIGIFHVSRKLVFVVLCWINFTV